MVLLFFQKENTLFLGGKHVCGSNSHCDITYDGFGHLDVCFRGGSDDLFLFFLLFLL